MLNTIYRGLLYLLVATVVIDVMIFASSQTPSYEECRHDEYAKAASDDAKKAQKGFSRTFVKCIGSSLDQNNGFITAIATALLAAITFFLAEIALGETKSDERQARAYLSSAVRIEVSAPNNLIAAFMLRVTFENTGATPARDCTIWGSGGLLPTGSAIPTYAKVGNGIGAGIIGSRAGRASPAFTVTWADFQQIVSGQKQLYLWAYVSYRDIFDERHHAQACLRAAIASVPNQNIATSQFGNPFNWIYEGPQNTED